MEAESNMFAGTVLENRPYYSDVYEANMVSYKLQMSVNLTASVAVQLFDLARFQLESNLAPLTGTLGLEGYTTSKLGDNCVWVYFEYASLEVLTKLSKTFATCGLNLRDVARDVNSW